MALSLPDAKVVVLCDARAPRERECENGRRSIATSWPPPGSEPRFPSSPRRSRRCHDASRTTVTEVEPLAERWVRLTFGDGAVHEVDLTGLFQAGGVLAPLRDERQVFEGVVVDHDFGTIMWPNDIDLDPDVLRGDQPPATGPSLPRRIIQPA